MQQGKKIDLETLATVIANTVKGVTPAKPKLRLVEAPPPTLFDSITRDGCAKRIRYLRKAYQLQWLVDQHTFNEPCLESLSDEAMSKLLGELEKARECIIEGISFDEAGLMRNLSSHAVFNDE